MAPISLINSASDAKLPQASENLTFSENMKPIQEIKVLQTKRKLTTRLTLMEGSVLFKQAQKMGN